MRTLQRLGLLAVLFIGLMMAGSAPASARSNQISGVAVFDLSGISVRASRRVQRLRELPAAPDERQLGGLLVHQG